MIDIPHDTIVDQDGNVVHGSRNSPIASIYHMGMPSKNGYMWEGCTYGFKGSVGNYVLKSIMGDWDIEVYRVGELPEGKALFFANPVQ